MAGGGFRNSTALGGEGGVELEGLVVEVSGNQTEA
jgi:hypothetical protein